MVSNGAYIKALDSQDPNNETTTWAVYQPATPTREVPWTVEADFNVTVGPTTIMYNITTTSASFVSSTSGELVGFSQGSERELSVSSHCVYTSTEEPMEASTTENLADQVEPSGVCTGHVVWGTRQGNVVTTVVSETMTGTEGYRDVTVLGEYATETGSAAMGGNGANGGTVESTITQAAAAAEVTAWKEAVVVVVAVAALAI